MSPISGSFNSNKKFHQSKGQSKNLRFLLVFFCLSSLAFPQSVTSIGGRVTDPSHAVISGAEVKLTLLTTGATREQTTDNTGAYEFSRLQPGQYSLRVNASGFRPVLKDSLESLVAPPML